MTRRPQSARALLEQALRALDQSPEPANDDEPAIDRQAIRERARRAAERMRRARNQG
jgi:hypothetical protein